MFCHSDVVGGSSTYDIKLREERVTRRQCTVYTTTEAYLCGGFTASKRTLLVAEEARRYPSLLVKKFFYGGDTCIPMRAGYPALLKRNHRIPNVSAEQAQTITIRCNQAFRWIFFHAINSFYELINTYIVLA